MLQKQDIPNNLVDNALMFLLYYPARLGGFIFGVWEMRSPVFLIMFII